MQSAGGTYSGDLLLDHTTHLVYKDLDLAKRGEKYATALSWGIPVLPFSWLQASAQCRSILPDTYKPVIAQAADASPATKMQQLHLQDDRLCHVTHTVGRVNAPNLQHQAEPQAEVPHSPLDIASQVRGQHTVLYPAQTSQHCSADVFDVPSCIGSCQPDLSEALLTQSPGFTVNLDESGSDTCSDHCGSAQSGQELSEANSAPAAAAAAAVAAVGVTAGLAHSVSPHSSTHDVILLDSQPDDSTTYKAGQHVMAEAPIPGCISLNRQSPGTIPDSPLEVTDQPLIATKHPRACIPEDASANAVCGLSDSWQACESPGQQPAACCLRGDDAVEDQRCEAIPDTEMQGPLPSNADMSIGQQLGADEAGRASSSHASVQVERQRAGSQSGHVPDTLQQQQLQQQPQQHQQQPQQHQQQQKQQKQQRQHDMNQQPETHQQHELDRLSFSASLAQGSPSTSCASRGVIIEDSDDESDFQACKPARPSTASSDADPSIKVACQRCVHLDVMVPISRMLRFLKCLACDFATGWCSTCTSCCSEDRITVLTVKSW